MVPLDEQDEDKGVKKWLEEHGAINVRWACMEDRYGFTIGGTEPFKVNRAEWEVVRVTPEEFLAQMTKWRGASEPPKLGEAQSRRTLILQFYPRTSVIVKYPDLPSLSTLILNLCWIFGSGLLRLGAEKHRHIRTAALRSSSDPVFTEFNVVAFLRTFHDQVLDRRNGLGITLGATDGTLNKGICIIYRPSTTPVVSAASHTDTQLFAHHLLDHNVIVLVAANLTAIPRILNKRAELIAFSFLPLV